MEINQTASRAAKRFLAERVRSDWDWPNTPEPFFASDEEVRGAQDFRTRYYGTTTSSETETEVEGNEAHSAYKFDSPDSVGAALENKAEAQKRRRRIRLESEMEWNEGLAAFVQRRNAWTGAAAARKYRVQKKDARTAAATDDDVSMKSQQSGGSKAEAEDQHEALVPVAPPLLPHNLVRDSIGPKIYPDIYDKVVASSRTPSVPINLSDMTRALVQGWKDNGEWPPKATPIDPLAGGRKRGALVGVKTEKGNGFSHHPHLHKGVESVKKLLRLNGDRHEHGNGGEKG